MRKLSLVSLILAAAASAQAPNQPAKLTPAETEAARAGAPFKQFSAWLDAFNSGDRERIRRYLETSYPTASLDGQLSFRAQTGGFDFRALEQATATAVSGLVQERNSDQFARFSLVVQEAEPHAIVRFGLNAVPRPAEFAIARLAEGEVVAALRDKLEKDAAADRFTGAAILGKIVNGKPTVLFSGAYGLADRERKVANTLDTRFRIGSMNKMFTAVSILQLAEAGKLALDDAVGKHIPGYPNRGIATKVTVRHLLTHTGGTGDIFGIEFDRNIQTLREHSDYLKLFGSRAPRFEPGSRFEYSNYGFVLLGAIIEA